MTNNEIALAFAGGETTGKANSMFIESVGSVTIIYSYGHHFPIAIRTALDVEGKRLYLFNSDKYSRTTSKQQGIVKRAVGAEAIATRDTEELKSIIAQASI